MQTATSTLNAGLDSADRELVWQATVDWPADIDARWDDLSMAVRSVSTDRDLVTELPDQVRQANGGAAAQATIVFASLLDPGDERRDAIWFFSPHNPESPLYRTGATGRDVVARLGAIGAAGPEYLRVITGRSTRIRVDPAVGTVTLTVLDSREKLRGPAQLPTIVGRNDYWNGQMVADWRAKNPGLTGQAAIDQLLRQAGIHSSPPHRTDCVFYASMHGTAQPELGAAPTVVRFDGTPAGDTVSRLPVPFRTGRWGQVPAVDPTSTLLYAEGSTTAPASVAAGGRVYFEGWVYVPRWTANYGSTIYVKAAAGADQSRLVIYPAFYSQTLDAAYASVGFERAPGGGLLFVASSPTFPPETWTYVAIFVEFPTSTTFRATYRINGTTSAATGTVAIPAAYGDTRDRLIDLTLRVWTPPDTWQLTTEAAPLATPNNAFVPGAVLDDSLSDLVVIPADLAGDQWEVIQAVASAELGRALFDEAGVFRFTNRLTARRAGPTQTITTSDRLRDVAVTVDAEAARDRIRVPITPYAIQPPAVVWTAPEAYAVRRKTTRTIIASLQDPITGLDTTAGIIPSGGPAANFSSGYRAARQRDGSGGAVANLRLTITQVDASTVRISVYNPNGFTAWLVSPAGTAYPDSSDGQPSLALWAQTISAQSQEADTGGVTAGGSAAEAVAGAGLRLLTLSASPWVQDLRTAQALADDLLSDLRTPVPVLDEVTVHADPRIQLGDLVTLVDPDGLRIAEDGWVVACPLDVDASDATSRLRVRLAAAPGGWLLGDPARSMLADPLSPDPATTILVR